MIPHSSRSVARNSERFSLVIPCHRPRFQFWLTRRLLPAKASAHLSELAVRDTNLTTPVRVRGSRLDVCKQSTTGTTTATSNRSVASGRTQQRTNRSGGSEPTTTGTLSTGSGGVAVTRTEGGEKTPLRVVESLHLYFDLLLSGQLFTRSRAAHQGGVCLIPRAAAKASSPETFLPWRSEDFPCACPDGADSHRTDRAVPWSCPRSFRVADFHKVRKSLLAHLFLESGVPLENPLRFLTVTRGRKGWCVCLSEQVVEPRVNRIVAGTTHPKQVFVYNLPKQSAL